MRGAFKKFRQQIDWAQGKPLVGFPYRYFFRWKKGLLLGASSMVDEQPWITFQAIDFLKKNVQPSHRVFEYGGGGSTMFFLNCVEEVCTVEHDEKWFPLLEAAAKKKRKSWQGVFIPSEEGNLVAMPDVSVPEHYASNNPSGHGRNFKQYASAIDQWQDASFDWVVVDGRARPSCLMHSLEKVRMGGFLVLDNSDREHYLRQTAEAIDRHGFRKILDGYGPSPYGEWFTQTTIWKRGER